MSHQCSGSCSKKMLSLLKLNWVVEIDLLLDKTLQPNLIALADYLYLKLSIINLSILLIFISFLI